VWSATESGEPLLRCLAEQARGVIEAYQACCSALTVLDEDESDGIDKKALRKRATQYFENSELLGEVVRPEAANDTTFSNVLDLLVERRILTAHSVAGRRSSETRYSRGEEWAALTAVRDRLAAALSSR